MYSKQKSAIPDNCYEFFRFYTYRAQKMHAFMIDFCYFLNVSTWLQILVCPSNIFSEQCEIWLKTNYVLAMGPISFAIVSWQNSLVFHSMDKVTSFLLHTLPGKVTVDFILGKEYT